MKLNKTQVEELQAFRVVVSSEKLTSLMPYHLFEDDDLLFERVNSKIEAPNEKVLASMWMRRYAFLLTAELFMYSKYRLYWTGSHFDVNAYDQYKQSNWLPVFKVSDDEWEISFNVIETFNQILYNAGYRMINLLHKRTNISKRILWENAWSYIIWMYTTKLIPLDEKRVREDLRILLHNETWKNMEGTSPFKQFAGNQKIDSIYENYERVTCCLYLKTPQSCGNPCPYCPIKKYGRKT